jgi:hypothetical protein
MIYKSTLQAANFVNIHITAKHRAALKVIIMLVMLALMATGVLADGTNGGTCGSC